MEVKANQTHTRGGFQKWCVLRFGWSLKIGLAEKSKTKPHLYTLVSSLTQTQPKPTKHNLTIQTLDGNQELINLWRSMPLVIYQVDSSWVNIALHIGLKLDMLWGPRLNMEGGGGQKLDR